MKILIIGATHGDELLGIKLYKYILTNRRELTEHVDFIIGNPRAFAKRTRYTERDLNRSYGLAGDSYEEQRAREIAQYIQKTSPDIVLDMHTTGCEQPNCLIVPNLEGAAKRSYLRCSHLANLLQVTALNDIVTLGDNVVGYEVPTKHMTRALLDAICDDIRRFIKNDGTYTRKKLYIMTDKIYKNDVTDQDIKQFVNFEMSHLGFVPIMTGENSYKKHTDYIGFKSEPPRDIAV